MEEASLRVGLIFFAFYPERTMTKADLVEKVASTIKLTKKETEAS
jgi:hypothetical protein